MRIIKYTALFCLLAIQTISSQTVINLSAPPTATQNPSIARDRVTMNPGFVYTATSGNSFRAAIDKTVVGDQDYNGSTTEVNNDEQGLAVRELNKNLQVGSVAGGLNVSASGSATYQIPIAVPQGIMGMQPTVSLVYNSQGGDGIMGMGWNLSCISAISRSGHSIYHDGVASGLLLEADDPLTMDGMRLISTDSQYKGLAGTNFVCEVANNTIITKQSNGGFIVLTPDGKTLEYGTTNDSRFMVKNNGKETTVSWLLKKVTDANGVFMQYNYISNATTGEVYLSSIEYSDKKMLFLYTDRTDRWTGNLLNAVISRTVLLEKIELFSNGNKIGSYDIKYNKDNGISLLTEVAQTNKDGESLNPTLFKWTKPEPMQPSSNPYVKTTDFVILASDQTFTGDFNVDGIEDLLVYRKKEYNPNEGVIYYGLGNDKNKAYQQQLYFLKGGPSGLELMVNEFELPRSDLFNNFELFLDRINSISTCDGQTYLDFSEFSYQAMHLKYFIDDISLVSTGDYNGDGVKEILVGVKEFVPIENCQARSVLRKMGDCFFNGENCDSFMSDFNYYVLNNKEANNTFQYRYYFINVDSNNKFIIDDSNILNDYKVVDATIDFNQDGKTDFVVNSDIQQSFYSLNHTTSSFEFLKTLPFEIQNVKTFDFNGDGMIDFASVGNSKVFIRKINGSFSELNFSDYKYENTYTRSFNRIFKNAFPYPRSGGYYFNWCKFCYNCDDFSCDDCFQVHPDNVIGRLDDIAANITCSATETPSIIAITDINNDGKNELLNIFYNQVIDISTSANCKQIDQIVYPYEYTVRGDMSRNYLVWTVIDFTARTQKIYLNQNYFLKTVKEENYKNQKLIPCIKTFSFDTEIPKFITLDINGDGWEDMLEISDSYLKKIKINNKNGGYTEQAVDVYVGENLSAGDFNGDGNSELISVGGGPIQQFIFNTGMPGYHILEVIDGLNNQTKITYKPLTDATVYEKESSCNVSYPLVNINAPLYVVSEVKSSTALKDGSNNEIWNTTKYEYKNLLVHLQGRGLLGFEKFITTSVNTDHRQVQTFEVNAPFYNMALKKVEVFFGATELLASTINTNRVESSTSNSQLFGKQFRPYVSSSVQTDNLKTVTINSTFSYDEEGKLEESKIQYGTDVTERNNLTYTSIGSSGIFYKVAENTKTKTYGNQGAFEQRQTFTYDDKGNVLTQVDFANTDKPVTTTYSNFNTFGMPSTIQVSAPGVSTATSTVEFDEKGRPVIFTNALIQRETTVYDPLTGNVIAEKDHLGNKVSYNYNAWGQVTSTVLPTGVYSYSTIAWATTADNTENALYKKTIQGGSKPITTTYYDAQGRELKAETYNAFNRKLLAKKVYDDNGRIAAVCEPYFSGETERWTNYTYDNYGRQKTVIAPTSTVSVNYNGRIVESIINEGTENERTTSKTVNANGDIISATDAMNNTVSYTYHSSGQPLSIEAAGATTSMTYNNKGQQISLANADAGTTHYEYDALGRLTKQTDARGYEFTMTYDVAGRSVTKTCPDNVTVSYAYKTNGLPDYILSAETGKGYHKQSFSYDSYGRTISVTDEIAAGETYTSRYMYDNYNRVIQKTYPSGYQIKYAFSDINGQLTKILKSNNAPIWELQAENSKGQVTQFKWGNTIQSDNTFSENGFLTQQTTGNIYQMRYTYDETKGNLLYRYDTKTGQQESFRYDALDRLEVISPDADDEQLITYAPNGNIRTKYDAGNYQYNLPAHPHAVTAVTGNTTIPSFSQTITYNAFGKVATITEDVNNMSIRYGTDQQRKEGKWYNNGTLVKTKKYLGDYEKTIKGSYVVEYNYIFAPTGLVAVMVNDGGEQGLYYVCTDHLGSLTVVNSESGMLMERYSYDAWGRQRDPGDWSNNSTNDGGILERGYEYTGHETLAEFGLINMNGRVYDPILGRMLSPDNYVQDPFNPQNYNRYGYCLNNPLLYTDPTGEFWNVILYNLGVYAFSYVARGLNTGDWNVKSFVKNSTFSVGYISNFEGVNSVNYQINTNIGGGYSITAGGGFGFNTQSWSATFSNGENSIGYYQTSYGRMIGPDGFSNKQIVGGVYFANGDWSFRFENDFFAFEHQDRWRTNAFELSYRNISFGGYIYTNDPKNTYGEKDFNPNQKSPLWGYNRPGRKINFGTWNNGKVYIAPLYLGYRIGNKQARVGYSHPSFQDFQQNGVHKYVSFGRQHYYLDYSEFYKGMYIYDGCYNPYSVMGN